MIIGQSVYRTNQPSHQLMSFPVCKENQTAVTSITITNISHKLNLLALTEVTVETHNYYPKNLHECKENIKHEKHRWIQTLATFNTDWSAPNISETYFVKSRAWSLLWVKSLFLLLILEQTCWRNES